MITTYLRFIAIGVASTITHVFVALLSAKILGLDAVSVNFSGFIIATVISYVGHTRFTFEIKPKHHFHLPRFLVTALLGLVLSSLIVSFSTHALEWSLTKAMFLVAIVTPVATFLMLKFWVFRLTDIPSQKVLIGALVSILPCVAFLKIYLGQIINHDSAWYLVATRKWLEGQSLYDKILEVNPPLNFYYTAPAIWLADVMGISDTAAQYALFATFIGCSLFWCWSILDRAQKFSDLKNILLVLGIGFTVVITGLPYAVQREHLLVVLLLPWIVGLLAQQDREKEKKVIGRAAFAAMGICLKPFFIIYPIFITAFFINSQRSLRPITSYANMTMALVGLCYVAFVTLVHPAYFSTMLPLAKLTYTYANTTMVILSQFEFIPLLGFIVLAIGSYKHNKRISNIFLSLVLSSLTIYLIQWKGFSYHLLPLYSWIVLFCCWTMVEQYPPIKLKVLALLLVTFISSWFIKIGIYQVYQTEWLMQRLQQFKPFSSLVVYSTYVSIGPILALRNDAEWASRYPTFWTIPAIANTDAEQSCNSSAELCQRLKVIAIETRKHIMDDLIHYSPELVVIDNIPGYITNRDFSLVKFFSHDAEIVEFLDSKYVVNSDSRFYYLTRK
ncbi:GtrA family protein [Shewanella sp. SR44-4]|uniref:GtrA family protein n=1 Tax=Shewanella sp. SR44-4 TaxID=2760935 RepID=UPI001603AC9A|nr:GtrA family protein [Shewanella sp. SR44-4]MBB1361927.1 GtrA family protein [Shewanella sp. SR44-4]